MTPAAALQGITFAGPLCARCLLQLSHPAGAGVRIEGHADGPHLAEWPAGSLELVAELLRAQDDGCLLVTGTGILPLRCAVVYHGETLCLFHLQEVQHKRASGIRDL